MKIKELSLTNFRRFEQLNLKLPDSNFIILIGENGCGKSSVLDAMGMGLANFLSQLTRGERQIPEHYLISDDINNESNSTNIGLKVDGLTEQVTLYEFLERNGKSRQGFKDETIKFVEIRNKLTNREIYNLPLLIYYSLNRTDFASEYTPDDGEPHSNKLIEGYKYAFSTNTSSFQDFKNWFITQENIENEQKITTKNLDFELVSLKIIRKVVIDFLTEIDTKEFTNLRVRRSSESNVQFSNPGNQGELTIQKNTKEVKLKQLSSGEKMILLLVCDIARRLLILNSMDENCLKGEGVVLIDEIEMHLHPKWQRRIIPALKKVFPNIQFIATTHSPQVLSNLSDNEIIVLDDNKYYSPATNPYGRDTNGILEEIFGTSERPLEADKLVDEIFDILSNGQHDMEKAEAKLGDLRGHLGAQDPILLRIENLINRKKILNH